MTNTPNKKIKKSNKKEKFEQLEIGFVVESKFEIIKRELRKKTIIFVEQLKISGFFSNLTMWNLIFLNIILSITLSLLIINGYSDTNSEIGLNLDNDRTFDTVVNYSYLWIIPIFHIIFAILVAVFGSISQKKINPLFLSSFIHLIPFVVIELVALNNFIQYFS
jgi:hypothetical protein